MATSFLTAIFIVCSISGLFYSTKTPFAWSSNETDFLALLAFKAAVFDPLGALNSWNDTLHYCRWNGITCGSKHRDRVVEINLMSQGLVGSLSPHAGNLSFLKKINLQNNSFYSQIPQQIGLLRRLKLVEFSNNSFGGEIPRNLSRCSDLVYLNLIDNRLRGRIPVELGFLHKLEQLGLSKNNFSGSIPPFLGNLTSLEEIALRRCGLSGEIPESFVQLRNLQYLLLAENSLKGGIPSGLFNISSILVFVVGYNQLQGTIPFNIGLTLPNLELLFLAKNQFSGVIPVSLSNATFLEHVYLYSNSFNGKMPKELGNLPNLQFFIISDNLIQDDTNFILSFTNCTYLRVFAVGDNMLSGSLSDSVANLSSKIEGLDISGTQIHGKLPSGIGNLVGLTRLLLYDNNFEGAIPFSIGELLNLQELYLGGNKFIGGIPNSLGNLTLLNNLQLERNNLSGNIPQILGNCTNLLSLDLSNNKLDGSIPAQIMNLSSISMFFFLSGNDFTGSIPIEVGSFKNLAMLDLSNNRLSGLIPKTLGSCISLERLHLEGNLLEGEIPPTLGDLKGLQDLDLSRNNLSGRIPNVLCNLNVENLNLSFNRLSGEVPVQGVFIRNTTKISLEGNAELCGGIVELKLPLCLSSNSSNKNLPNLLKILIPALVAGGLCITLCVSLFRYFHRRNIVNNNQSTLMPFDGDQFMRLSYPDIFKATGGFSQGNLVGAGRFGRVYKAILEDGKTLAVKVLNLYVEGSCQSFLAECKALKGIRHRNLLKLLSICESIDHQKNEFKALIYEFMAGGSLERLLHRNREQEEEHCVEFRSLNLLKRLDIIIDIAHALEYLHNGTDSPIIHGDLKPSNILLDQDMTAHVGDFGLSKVVSNMFSTPENSCSTIGIRGTLGYIPPEYGTNTPMSTIGDVYSFGILVLEILTGMRPTDEAFKDSLNLHNFVSSALPNHIAEIVDPLVREEFQMNDKANECVASVLRIGVACSKDIPSGRMSVAEVVRELCKTRDEYTGIRLIKN